MRRGLFILVAIVFGSCFQLVAQVSWNAGSGSWDSGDNWVPQGVPVAPDADEVYITNGGSVFITNAVPAVDRIWVGSNSSFSAASVIGSGCISNHFSWVGLRAGTGNVALIDGGMWVSDQFFILGHSSVDNRLTVSTDSLADHKTQGLTGHKGIFIIPPWSSSLIRQSPRKTGSNMESISSRRRYFGKTRPG